MVSTWSRASVTHAHGTAWDLYALYTRDTTRGSEPPRALSQGGTIISRRNQLALALGPPLGSGS